jgi:hypothetical protein
MLCGGGEDKKSGRPKILLDKMPDDVKESLEVKDASNDAPVQV